MTAGIDFEKLDREVNKLVIYSFMIIKKNLRIFIIQFQTPTTLFCLKYFKANMN